MSTAVRLLVLLALWLGLALPGAAREEIRAYASDVTLGVDGTAHVVETIEVNAEGNQIRRGIYRDIPVTMVGASGNKIRIGLDVQSVTRNGRAEAFRLERMGDFQRIWIGDPDVTLTRGEHVYVLRYAMDRMARPIEGGDEFYWNATGNYWNFPILSAVARLSLPEGAVIGDIAVYTGATGSTETAASVSRVDDRTVSFRAQRQLGPGEGMSYAVSFQKGIIAYPEGGAALVQALSDMREVWLPIGAVIVLLFYNFAAWLRVGRDPPKGTIIPLFHPPRDFSPALTHYVHNWGFAKSGWTAMTAAIFDLGVKGLVSITNKDDTLTVATTGQEPDAPLPVGERVLFAFFKARGSVTFDKTTGKDLDEKRTEFIGAIESENRLVWFNHNTIFAVFSFVLAAGMIGAMVWFDILDPIWLFVAFVIGVVGGVFGSAAVSAIKSGGLFQRFMILVWGTILVVNLGGGVLENLTSLSINSAAIAAASMVAISVVFTVLLRAPTVQGRKVMDEIEGFKLYLDTAEKNRLNIVDEPPMTVGRFERILPYAIALGVEKPWSEHFEAELSRNAVSDASGTQYSPNWYSGSRSFSSGGLSRAVGAASTGMAAAMIAAQPVQASSSGSGGGGFSGGGGGGGGGGGW